MVAGVELDDPGRPRRERALPVGWGALVLRADQVGGGHVVPGRFPHGLLEDSEALPCGPAGGLALGLRIAVLQERLSQGVGPYGEGAAFRIDVEERCGRVAAE